MRKVLEVIATSIEDAIEAEAGGADRIELTRDLAISFNQKFGDVFTVPEPVIPKFAARIKSLRDGMKKMSKSDASEQSRINLNDTADVIADKVKRFHYYQYV